MLNTKNRRFFDREFKVSVIRLILEEGRKASELARDFDIHPVLISKWKKEFMEEPGVCFPGRGNLKPQDEELRRLREELRAVKQERDILKKALAIFSKRPI